MNSHTTPAKASTLHRLAALYPCDSLPEIVDLIDQLHTAASDGQLPMTTTLPAEDVADLLEELIYVAQEALNELRLRPALQTQRRREPILRLLPVDTSGDRIEADAS